MMQNLGQSRFISTILTLTLSLAPNCDPHLSLASVVRARDIATLTLNQEQPKAPKRSGSPEKERIRLAELQVRLQTNYDEECAAIMQAGIRGRQVRAYRGQWAARKGAREPALSAGAKLWGSEARQRSKAAT